MEFVLLLSCWKQNGLEFDKNRDNVFIDILWKLILLMCQGLDELIVVFIIYMSNRSVVIIMWNFVKNFEIFIVFL